MGDGRSIWKKEISLSRKRRPKAEKPTPAEDAPAKASFWKKEVTIGRKAKAAGPVQREVAEPVAVEAEPVVEMPVPDEREPLEEVAPAPEPEPVHEAPRIEPPPRLPMPAPIPDPEPDIAAVETGWESPATLPPEPESESEPEPHVAPQVAALEAEPEPEPQPDEPEAKTPWWKKEVGGRKRSSKPLPEDDDTASKPFWKKEIALGRGGKRPKPESVPAPLIPPVPEIPTELPASLAALGVEAPAGIHPPVPASELPPLDDEKRPFWKKEIGGRKHSSTRLPEDDKPPRKPFWKNEVLIGRRRAKAVAEPVEAIDDLGSTPARAKRKGLSLSLPTLAALPSLASLSKSAPGKSGKNSKNGKAKRLVGLKIGASQIAAARVANNGTAELLGVARQPLEQGVVVSGEVRDPEALAEQLRAFFARNKLPRKNVRLGIASNRIGVRIFDVVGIDDDKALANAIQFRAQEALPIPLDEAVLDYHVLDRSVDDEGQPVRRVLLVVAYRELVDRYVSACRKAGLVLAGIDLEAFALLRALAPPREEGAPSTAAFVAVSIGHDRSTFAVSDGRVCEFTRVLEWGGAAVSIAIARALDSAPSEVEGIKRSLSLEEGAPLLEGLSAESSALAVDAVRKQVQAFARELVSSLQFYQNQPGSLGISEIVLTGGTAHLPGLAEELQRLIGVNVRVGNPLGRVKIPKKVAAPDQIGSFAVAIGLGIED